MSAKASPKPRSSSGTSSRRHDAEDQALVDVMTDKATVEMPSPVGGMVIVGGRAPAMSCRSARRDPNRRRGGSARLGEVAAAADGRERRRSAAATAADAAAPDRARAPPSRLGTACHPVTSPRRLPVTKPRGRRPRCAGAPRRWASTCTSPAAARRPDRPRRSRAISRARARRGLRLTPVAVADDGCRPRSQVIGLRRNIAQRMQDRQASHSALRLRRRSRCHRARTAARLPQPQHVANDRRS